MAKVRRAARTVMLVPPEYLPANWDNAGNNPADGPTAAQLNLWQAIETQAGLGAVGGNISCALTDSDLELGLGDPDTDDELTICSKGNESSVTRYNPTVDMVGLRDSDIAANSVENLFFNLVNAADVEFVAVDRIQDGKNSDDPFAIGDNVTLIGFNTDNPVDVKDDQANLKIQQTGLSNGRYLINFRLVA